MLILLLISISSIFLFTSCQDATRHKESFLTSDLKIGGGQMPDVATDNKNNVHLVYGHDDSIFYVSSDDAGKKFSDPSLIAVEPGLFSSHTRGPQITTGSKGLTVIACNKSGNIFSYFRSGSGEWLKQTRINDMDTTAKEGFIALHADGDQVFAVWLDMRNKHNEIFGSGSKDGGKTWSSNKMIYASPDTSVCECCKPTVLIKGTEINVMFRNRFSGYRDMYLIQSKDAGKSFSQAHKLGAGSWPLAGCPMDGGGMTMKNNNLQTVWRRKNKIYACEPGKPETAIGEGQGCTIATVNGQTVYCWTHNGEVVLLKPKGELQVIGKGNSPRIETVDNNNLLCIYESDKQIYTQIISIVE
ncbi:hypothetical protein [Flavitalea sp.]|nr:sialidase family protein [Flavitalea sp.]